MKKNKIFESDISKKVADIHEEIQPALYEYNENLSLDRGELLQRKLKSYYDSMIWTTRLSIPK